MLAHASHMDEPHFSGELAFGAQRNTDGGGWGVCSSGLLSWGSWGPEWDHPEIQPSDNLWAPTDVAILTCCGKLRGSFSLLSHALSL